MESELEKSRETAEEQASRPENFKSLGTLEGGAGHPFAAHDFTSEKTTAERRLTDPPGVESERAMRESSLASFRVRRAR